MASGWALGRAEPPSTPPSGEGPPTSVFPRTPSDAVRVLKDRFDSENYHSDGHSPKSPARLRDLRALPPEGSPEQKVPIRGIWPGIRKKVLSVAYMTATPRGAGRGTTTLDSTAVADFQAENRQLRDEMGVLTHKLANYKEILAHCRASYDVAVQTLMRTILKPDETVAIALLMEKYEEERRLSKAGLMTSDQVDHRQFFLSKRESGCLLRPAEVARLLSTYQSLSLSLLSLSLSSLSLSLSLSLDFCCGADKGADTNGVCRVSGQDFRRAQHLQTTAPDNGRGTRIFIYSYIHTYSRPNLYTCGHTRTRTNTHTHARAHTHTFVGEEADTATAYARGGAVSR